MKDKYKKNKKEEKKMAYRILRNETSKDRNGKDRHFLNIEIITENDCFLSSEWLCPADLEAVLKDPKAIDAVAAEAEKRAILKRPAVVAREAHERAIELAAAQK